MRTINTYKPFIAWLLCLLLLPGFTWDKKSNNIGQQKYVEFTGHYHGRSNGKSFYKNDKNVSAILKKGTRGEILEYKKLPTGNFGLHIKVISGTNANEYFWVYHDLKDSHLNLYESTPSNWSDPGQIHKTALVEKARVLETTRDTVAFKEEQKTVRSAIPKESPQTLKPEEKSVQESSEPTPIIEHALDRIETINGFQNLFGSMDNTANRNCSSCDEKFQNMRYMQCNRQNDYLENEIATASKNPGILGDVLRAPIRSNSIIKPTCIQIGMNLKFGARSKNFRECSAKGNEGAVRPCISKNYFTLVNNSFDLVSSCMKDFIAPHANEATQKLDVRAVYALINIESGFHVNAMSSTGASGIGQFTQAAIKDVNSNELHAVRAALKNHPNPQCREMGTQMLASTTPINPSRKSCDRISLVNGNPIKNMIYTYAYLTGTKKDMNSMIFENRHYKNKFKLSKFDLNKIRRALMVWSHNTGPAGTWTPAKALLNTFYRGKPVTNADQFINQLQQYMQKFPASANKSRVRRKETSRYFPSITENLNNIENSIGGGSCVNF